jgi:hypothetical protein
VCVCVLLEGGLRALGSVEVASGVRGLAPEAFRLEVELSERPFFARTTAGATGPVLPLRALFSIPRSLRKASFTPRDCSDDEPGHSDDIRMTTFAIYTPTPQTVCKTPPQRRYIRGVLLLAGC